MLGLSPFMAILITAMVANVCLSGTWELSIHNHLLADHDRILSIGH